MWSVVEVHVAIICASIPTLGYKRSSNWIKDWVKNNCHGEVRGESGRGLTIGFGQNSGDVEGEIELDDIAEHHRRYEPRVIDF